MANPITYDLRSKDVSHYILSTNKKRLGKKFQDK
ncbi:hypothetical protein CKF99_09625 [Staphylococcus epidermidis]|nr:hypothetical protein CKF99_09625 [Staphylococcus epidermidis]